MARTRPRTQLIRLDARLTFRYVQGWRGEDDWEPLTQARLTAGVQTAHDYEDYSTTHRHLLTFGPANWQEAQQLYHRLPREDRPSFVRWLGSMVAEHFAYGCRCEHDCCGHLQGSASTTYIGQRRFSVERRTTRNV